MKYGELEVNPGREKDLSGMRSFPESRLSAIDPTSIPSVHLCNRFSVDTSFSTPLSLYLEFRCCIDRLNPQP